MKKNLRKVPQRILQKLDTIPQDDIVVATALRIKLEDASQYAPLGLRVSDGKFITPTPFIPPSSAGRYSRANVEGRDVILRDLPMVEKTSSWETPNWGDWGKGSHTHYRTRMVYQTSFIPPKEVPLSITILRSEPGGAVIKFAVEQVLKRDAPDFEDDLLYNLNILQENVGSGDVFPSDASFADYAATIKVDWEILPAGNIDEIVEKILKGKRPVSDEKRRIMVERLKAIGALKPQHFIAGTNEFLRYFGAKFKDDLVVFENLNYGNALYVMYEAWEELSKRSRIDLLKGPRDGFDRIEHGEGWREKLAKIIREKMT